VQSGKSTYRLIAASRTPPSLLSGWGCRVGVFPEGQEVLAKRFARMLPLITNTQAEIELGQVRAANSAPHKKRRGL